MPGFSIKVEGCTDGEDQTDAGYEGPNPNVETGRKYRYRLRVLEPVQDVLLYAYKCQRPTSEVDRIVMHHGQDEIYKPGKSRWLPIEVTFYEVITSTNITAQYLSKWWGKAMVNVQDSLLNRDSSFKKTCELEMVDGDGNPIWLYKMFGVWPSKVSGSDFSYTDTDLSEITCTLEIGKVIEEDPID